MALDNSDQSSDWLWHAAPCPHVVGYTLIPGDWMDARRMVYDQSLLVVGPGGHIDVEFDDGARPCPALHYLIIPPGRWHRRRARAAAPFRRYWLHFDWTPGRKSTGQLQVYTRGQPDLTLVRPAPRFVPRRLLTGPIPRPATFLEKLERLNDRFHQGPPPRALRCRGMTLEILIDLLARESPSRPAPDARRAAAHAIRQRLAALAEEPFSRSENITPLLESTGQSYDHQARLFKDVFGVTPLEYVNTLRIERAKDLLRDTDLPVKRIAHQLGFADIGYFNRLFRQHTGATPRALRGQR